MKEKAICRGCGRVLRGKPYAYGGPAFHPETDEQCPINHYGGYVCSRACDVRACFDLENSMPGHTGQIRIGDFARERVESNWDN